MSVAAYPKYESYRDSGIGWVGEIPTSWAVRRGKWLFKKMDRPVRPEDEIVTCFRDGMVTLRTNRRTEGFTNALKEHGYQGIRKGDLVIHAMDAFAGAVGVSDSDGKSTPVYSACVPRVAGTVDPSFYAYYMRHIALSGLLVAMAKGIRERSTDFRFNDFADLALAAPPIEEQKAIVAFLDGKSAGIDEAVRIKEAQIKLLSERKQILVQEAVTRGLNPAAPMKDSGIDWIGQIPAHWEVRRGKHHFREVNERSDEGNEELLSVSHTTGVTARSEKNVNMFLAEDYTGSKLCQPGDVVINTMWAWMGALGVSDLAGIISPSYGVYRPLQKGAFNRRFLEWLLRTTPFIEQYNKISTGLHSSRLRLYPHMFLGLPMAFPSRDEQDAIVTHVENESGKVDKAISIKKDQIAALKEYKTSLINAAVTGKIKVI